MFSYSTFANFLELKPIPVIVTINGQKSDSAIVEVGGEKFYTDKNGLTNLNLEVGVYEVKVSKGEHVQLFDVVINDNTSFMILEIEDYE